MKTIFEKIIDREIPADIVYEDDVCMAFLDIAPVKKGHTLLISKKPYQWIDNVSEIDLSHIMITAQKIIRNMKSSLGVDYVHVVVEGLDVPHFHVHLIPSFISKKNATWHHEQYDSPEEKQYYIEQLKKPLN
jgi:histidine triad (HIT) family protein